MSDCISRFTIIFWAFQGEAAEATLDVKAGLVVGAGMRFCNTLINILTVPCVGCQLVTRRGASALKTPWDVNASIGTDMSSSGQSTFINIFTCDPVYVTELIAPTTVALIRSVNISTFLAAGTAFTFIQVFT